MVPAGNRIDVVIELFDGTVLQFSVQISDKDRFIDKQLFRVFAVALGHAFHELHRRFFNGLILFQIRSHSETLLLFSDQYRRNASLLRPLTSISAFAITIISASLLNKYAH